MSPELQSTVALLVVALTVVWFIARALAKRRSAGCGDHCAAVSRDVKDLQSKLRTK